MQEFPDLFCTKDFGPPSMSMLPLMLYCDFFLEHACTPVIQVTCFVQNGFFKLYIKCSWLSHSKCFHRIASMFALSRHSIALKMCSKWLCFIWKLYCIHHRIAWSNLLPLTTMKGSTWLSKYLPRIIIPVTIYRTVLGSGFLFWQWFGDCAARRAF